MAIWLHHFNTSKTSVKFDFIKELSFIKNRYFPLYQNIGKHHTRGLSYSLGNHNTNDFKKKVFLIYDIPIYKNLEITTFNSLKIKKVKQYKGYLADLSDFKKLDDYIIANFSKRSKRVFKKNIYRLEACFNIKYKMYFGKESLTKGEYAFIFKHFKKLLEKRYEHKGESNSLLEDSYWNYQYNLV